VTRPLLLALLWALATLAAYRSRHRPALRRGAAGLLLLAVASSVRHALPDHPHGAELRLDVVLSCLWPAVAAWLVASESEIFRESEASNRQDLQRVTGIVVQMLAKISREIFRAWAGLAVVAYAVALALGWHRVAERLGWVGELERPRWLAALQLPRYAVGALATVMTLRWGRKRPQTPDGGPSWTASQRIGLWLAAGQVVMVGADALERAVGVSGLWSRWEVVRAASAFFYLLCALVVLGERRPR